MRHILSDFDLNNKEVLKILDYSMRIKAYPAKYYDTLHNNTLIMVFELPSLRTRVSFETGMTQLGGHAIYYRVDEGGFSRSETLEDGVKVLSRYSDVIMIRALQQAAVVRMSKAATVPIINGMTEKFHPCQNLADLLTMREKKGDLDEVKIAYVGDGGCNTANSTMIGCANAGMDVTVVCPDNPKYSPNIDIINRTKEQTGKEVRVDHDPERGVEDADVIYTDVWISAGMERERIDRMKLFPPYQVNTDLVSKADPEVIVMHCMPAHRGYEITGEVMDSDRSVIIDQAENRMHAQKGLLYWLLKT